VRLKWGLGGILLMASVGGCTSNGHSPTWGAPSGSAQAGAGGSAPPYAEPAAYTYVLTRGCDAVSPLGRYKVAVRDGAVVSSERLDAAVPSAGTSSDTDLGPVTGQDGEEIKVPTLAGLIAMARTAADDGGAVTTTYDTSDGHPVKVVVDVSDTGPASAECFTVSNYAPTS